MLFSAALLPWWLQMLAAALILGLVARPLGLYMARVMEGEGTLLSPLMAPLERRLYRLCGVDPYKEMDWKTYAASLLLFSALCAGALFLTVLAQSYPEIPPSLAFNIAISFVTSANWQAFAPETTLTTTSQFLGIVPHSFLSSAVGLCVFFAMTRGLAARKEFGKIETIGNFWADFVRGILYILLPGCFLLAVFLISQGVVQTFEPFQSVQTLETDSGQTLLLGPVASQTAIKQFGTNGGGYYAANAAHPFENPTPLSNFIQLLAMLALPIALTSAYGRLIRHKKQGNALLIVMGGLLIAFSLPIAVIEQAGNPLLTPLGVDQSQGLMEGKEVRFGATGSTLWAAATTATANGATNAALDSFMPLSSGTALLLIQLGEVVFGGVGTGFASLLVFVIFAVFVAGLVIGRAPDYLGKKIGTFEIQMAGIVFLLPILLSLGGTALALVLGHGEAAITNPGAQGFAQMLHAFSSASNNNGAALAGLRANTPFFNISLGLCMFLGRFGQILALLALAGSFANKPAAPPSQRLLDTTTPLFAVLLVLILLSSAMAYAPALALGPLHEHLLLIQSLQGDLP